MPRETRLEWNADAWSLSSLPALRARVPDPLVESLLGNPRLRLEAARRATPAARRGPPLELTVRVPRAESASVLARLSSLYEGRIYAFNHPTVGTTPLENARAFLDAMPARVSCLDFLTHSRGGVVLRALAEHPSLAKERARKLEISHAVLVAAPN